MYQIGNLEDKKSKTEIPVILSIKNPENQKNETLQRTGSLEKAREQIQYKKDLLSNKNDDLALMKTKIKDIHEELNVLQRYDINEDETKKLHEIQSEELLIIMEERKAELFKEVNISQRNLTILSDNISMEGKVDNLIKCVLNIAYKNYSRVNLLLSGMKEKKMNEKLSSQMFEIKRALSKQGENIVDQKLLDEISNKVMEMIKSGNDSFPRCVLLADLKSFYSHEKFDFLNHLIIYEFKNDYFLLKPDEFIPSMSDRIHQVLNNLMYEELIGELCKLKYKELLGKNLDEADIAELFKCFDSIKRQILVEDDAEQKEMEFLKYIKLKSEETFSEVLLNAEINRLMDYFDRANESERIDNGIIFFRKCYIKTLETIIFEECDKRKKIAEKNILSDSIDEHRTKDKIQSKQKEIDLLTKDINEKEKELKSRLKDIDIKNEQIKLLNESFKKQEKEILTEIEKYVDELSIKEKEFQYMQKKGESCLRERETIKNDIEQLKSHINELNKSKESLEKKRNELKDISELNYKECEKYKRDRWSFENQKKTVENDKNKIENDLKKLKDWHQFIQDIHKVLLNNCDLYKKKEFLRKNLEKCKTLEDKYDNLINEKELSHLKSPELKLIAKENKAFYRETLEDSLKKILSKPKFMKYRNRNNIQTIEFSGININISEAIEIIYHEMEKELLKMNLCFKEVNAEKILVSKDNDYKFIDVSKENQFETSEELKDLFDRHIKARYLIEKKDLDKSGRLSAKTVIADIGELGNMKINLLLNELKVTDNQVLPCFFGSLRLVASNNLFVDVEKIEFRGINLGMEAGNDILLPKIFNLNTSGYKGLQFKNEQAFGEIKPASKLMSGKSGQDGFDGLSGGNGGHIYMKAGRKIQNFEFVDCINNSGGDGASGQKGGCGQKGGDGEDTGDAQAENLSYALFAPKFSAAFARIPGYNTETQNFDIESEKSGNGGNAGNAGFGGLGGQRGSILISDSSSWIKYSETDSQSIESSEDLKKVITNNKIISLKGLPGKDAGTDVKGGSSGEPGSYGCDNIKYETGFFGESKNLKGDYSNYLLEGDSSEYEKFRSADIFSQPDLYAKHKNYYKYSGYVGITIGIGAALLVGPAIVAVLPVVGIAGVVSSYIASGILVSFIASTVATASAIGSILTYNTVRGLSYTVGVENGKQKINRLQIKFNNRYCDDPPVRNEDTCRSKQRIDQRSRGKNGENSQKKNDLIREDHSNTKRSVNEFSDLTELARFKRTIIEENEDKDYAGSISSILIESNNLTQKKAGHAESIKEISKKLNECEERIHELIDKISVTEKELKEIDHKLTTVDSILIQNHLKLSESEVKSLQNVEQFLSDMESQTAVKLSYEFIKINLNGKKELRQELQKKYLEIKNEVLNHMNELKSEQAKIQVEIEKKKKEILKKKSESESLKKKEMDAFENKRKNENEIVSLNNFQKKLIMESSNKEKTSLNQEMMVVSELNIATNNQKQLGSINRKSKIKLEKSIISNDRFKNLFTSVKELPSLEILINSVRETFSNQVDTALNQLDFLINAYSKLIYVHEKNSEQKPLLNVQKCFLQLSKNPKTLKGIYEDIAKNFFRRHKIEVKRKKLNHEVCFKEFNLELHYDTRNLKNQNLSDLEIGIINFLHKGKSFFNGKQNIYDTINLVNQYKSKIQMISNLEYPAMAVIQGNINTFYSFIIEAIIEKLKTDAEDKRLWNDLSYIIELINVISSHLNEIDSYELWKNLSLMQNEKNLVNSIYCINEEKLSLDKMKHEIKSDIYKIELLEEYLQPKLINSMLKKEKLEEYNELKEKISKMKVRNRQEKDFIKFNLTCIKNKTSNSFAEEKLTKEKKILSLNEILKHSEHIESEDILSERLRDFIYSLTDESKDDYENRLSIYKNLTDKRINKILKKANASNDLFRKLERLLSEKCEDYILSLIDHKACDTKEFKNIFLRLTNERLRFVDDRFMDMVLIKAAFYNKIKNLIAEISDDENKWSKIIFLMESAVAQLTRVEIEPFDKTALKFFKKLDIEVSSDTNNCEAFEDVLFCLSDMQYVIFMESINFEMNQNNNPDYKSKFLEDTTKKFNNYLKIIRDVKCDNYVIKALKDYVSKLDVKISDNETAKKLERCLNAGEENNFISYVIQLKNKIDDVRLVEIIQVSLHKKFHEYEWKERNESIFSILTFYENNIYPKSNKFDFYQLFNLIELNELFKEESCEELVEFIFCMNKLNGLNVDIKRKTIEGLRVFYNNVISKPIEISKSIIKISNSEKVIYICNCMIELFGKIIEDNIAALNFELAKNVQFCLNKYINNMLSQGKTDTEMYDEELFTNIIEIFRSKLKNQLETLCKDTNVNPHNYTEENLIFGTLNLINSEFYSFEKLKTLSIDYIFIGYLELILIFDYDIYGEAKTTKIEDLLEDIKKQFSYKSTLGNEFVQNIVYLLDKKYLRLFDKKTDEIIETMREFNDHFNDLTFKIIDSYGASILDQNNEFAKKSRINFITEIVLKLLNNIKTLSISEQKEIFECFQAYISQTRDCNKIENFLVDQVNKYSLAKINELVKSNDSYKKFLNDIKEDLTLNSLFNLLFGNEEENRANTIISRLIHIFGKKYIEENNPNDCIFKGLIQFISYVLENIYFNDYDKQRELEKVEYELETFFYDQDENLYDVLNNLCNLILKANYKTNYFQKYIDLQFDFQLCNIDKNYSIFNTVKSAFEEILGFINLANQQEVTYIKKYSIVNQLLEKFEIIKTKMCSCSFDDTINEITNSIECLNEFKSNNVLMRTIIDKREKIQKILMSENAENFFSININDIGLMPIQKIKELIETYENKLILKIELKIYKYELDNHKDDLILKHFEMILKSIAQIRDDKLKLFIYAIYSLTLQIEDSSVPIKSEFLDSLAIKICNKIFNIQITNGHVSNLLNEILNKKNSFNKKDHEYLVILIPLLSQNEVNMKTIRKIFSVLFPLNIHQKPEVFLVLLEHYCNYTEIDPSLAQLVTRIINFIKNKEDKILQNDGQENLNRILKILFAIDKNTEYVSLITQHFDLFIKTLLKSEEIKFVNHLEKSKLKTLLCNNLPHLWIDEFENEFLHSLSEKILEKEVKILLNERPKLSNEINQLLCASYYDNIEKNRTFDQLFNINKNIYQDITRFKMNQIILKERVLDKPLLIGLFEVLKNKKIENKLNLNEVTEVLFYSRQFDEISQIIDILNNNQRNFLKEILLSLLKNYFFKIFQTRDVEERSNDLVEIIRKNYVADDNKFLKKLIIKVRSDLLDGLKYQTSEIELLHKTLDLSFKYGLNESNKILVDLDDHPLFKWINLLKIEILKRELSIDGHDDELINEILFIESNKGEHLAKRFLKLIKTAQIHNLLLKFIVKKFKRNEWELSNTLLDELEKLSDSNKWINVIEEHNNSLKNTELTAYEIVSEMKKHESALEINSYIKTLLDRSNGKSLIERCIDDLEKIEISYCVKISKDNADKPIHLYDKKDIRNWADNYRKVSKVDINTIQSIVFLDLVKVIERAAIIVFGHGLRLTQKISLLVFIDSIINNNNGRLANISTGEGKTLITISIALSQLLIKGGNVDILTSSEILAVRDAEESKPIFEIFGFTVSNNCDLQANHSQKVRKDRYETNSVIYGEIGHFQRDILLTKYYDQDIRKCLAKCLIVDEVDSMCIDNICNTLYISHQIADLKHMKPIYVQIWKAINDPEFSEYNSYNCEKIKEYIEKLIEKEFLTFPKSLKEFVERRLLIWIKNAYQAKYHLKEGNHYSSILTGKKKDEVVINDLQTGVEQLNTQWSEGLQQFIQLKHTKKLTDESLKAIFMSNYIFFNEYNRNIYGMTGTLGGSLERDLLSGAYGLDFFQLPRFKRDLNVREDDILVETRAEWLDCIKREVHKLVSGIKLTSDQISCQESMREKKYLELESLDEKVSDLESKRIKDLECELKLLKNNREKKLLEIEYIEDLLSLDERNSGGRAVLIICENKRDVNEIVRALLANHKHLYEYNGKIDGLRKIEGSKKQPITINQVRPGDIIVATNIAGRGTDLKISKLLSENGGLHVIMSYMPNNVRVEQQGFGRSGRKGEPGSGRIIVYDSRKNHIENVEFLKKERDEIEEKRLNEIRVKMIPRVKIEKELFEKFNQVQESLKRKIQAQNSENSELQIKSLHNRRTFWLDKISEYVKRKTQAQNSENSELQIKSLHNKWAFWLDKMSNKIKKVFESEETRNSIFKEFENFRNEIDYMLENQILISELGELIKLAKFYLDNKEFVNAKQCCDKIINDYGKNCDAFVYYYKAAAVLNANSKKNVISVPDKKIISKLLKKSIMLLEDEINIIQNQSFILSNIQNRKIDSGIGSSVDYFSKSNSKLISSMQLFLNSAKSALPREIIARELAYSLDDSILTQDKKIELFEFIINHKEMKEFIKHDRLCKKIRFRWHIIFSNFNKLKSLLGEDKFSKNQDGYTSKEFHSIEDANFFVTDELSNKEQHVLRRNYIDFSVELYHLNILTDDYEKINIPSSFDYCKSKLFKEFKYSEDRENVLEIAKSKCLNRDQIWTMISKHTEIVYQVNQNIEQVIHILKDESLENSSEIIRNKFENISKTEDMMRIGEFQDFLKSIKPKNFDKLVSKLVQTEAITELHKFNTKKFNLLEKHFNTIVLNEDATEEKLRMTLDLKDVADLNEIRDDIIGYLMNSKNNRQISLHDFFEIFFKEKFKNDDSSKLLDLVRQDEKLIVLFKILKNNLILNGFSKSVIRILEISDELNQDEMMFIEDLIESLFEKRHFNEESISDYFMSVDDFYDFLKSKKVIKSAKINFSLKASNNKQKEQRLTEKIRHLATTKLKNMILAEDKNNEREKLTELVLSSFLDTISPLTRFKECEVQLRNMQEYYKQNTMPMEAFQFIELRKDLVLSFSKYESPFSWKSFAIAAFGTIQIAAGAALNIYPILGPWSLSIGSGLIAEGVNDLRFALNSGGHDYLKHKIKSLAVTSVSCLIGGILTNGTALFRFGMEGSTKLAIGACLKHTIHEIAKLGLNELSTKIVDFFSSKVTSLIFQSLKNKIIDLIRLLPFSGYKDTLSKISNNLNALNKYIDESKLGKLLNETINDCEKQLNDGLVNKVNSFISKLGGSMSNQLEEAAKAVEFSGLTLQKHKLENCKLKMITKIINAISIVCKIGKFTKCLYDLKQILYDLIVNINKRIEEKLDSLQKQIERVEIMYEQKIEKDHASLQIEGPENQTRLTNRNEVSTEKYVNQVENSIFSKLQSYIETTLMSPFFMSLINHSLKPIYSKLDSKFNDDYNNLKKRSLAYSDYVRRFEANKSEKGLEIELVKDIIMSELSELSKNLNINAPIKEINLEDLSEGKLNMHIDGNVKELDLKRSEDREFIKDRIGSLNLRILPGDPPQISRPNFSDYVKSWDMNKQMNEFDIEVVAHCYGRLIIVETDDGSLKAFGESNGKPPLILKHLSDGPNQGHYMPVSHTKSNPVDDINSSGKSCGLASILYLIESEKLVKQGLSDEDAHKKAQESTTEPKIKIQLEKLKIQALNNGNLKETYCDRKNETTKIIGGQKKKIFFKKI